MTNSGAPKAASPPPKTARLHIDDLLANGQGVGRLDTLVAFVTGALPGEDVELQIDARKPNYSSGHATAILAPSPDRVAPPCPVFPECGGCQVLHLRYEAQLEWKRRMLVEALARIGGLGGVTVEVAEPSPLIDATRYRNKVALVAGKRNAHPPIGFYAARSHTLVPVRHCPVLLPRLDRAVRQFIAFAQEQPQVLADVRHIVLRTTIARDSLVLCLSTRRRPEHLGGLSANLRERVAGLTGLVASWDPANDNAVFGRRFATLWGSPTLCETVAGLDFSFTIASFFQINTALLEHIARNLIATLGTARRVIDLYCGVGTFAILLGKQGVSGTGVELDRAAVDDAAVNAARNGVSNVVFECASAEQAVSGVRGRTLLAGADAVILDPPRRGCEPQVLQALARERVPRIEYLSCNPATLARDAKLLVDGGYRLGRVKPYDMFPHTGHVEALAEFELTPGKER